MKERRIGLAAVAIAAMMASPAAAENFLSKFTKDLKDLTESFKSGIEDLTQSKEDVEGIVGDVKELTGTSENEPRYDPAWVAEVQQRLAVQGFDPGPVDGAFGNKTSRAITAFQRQAGISVDGLPRPSVMRALRARTQTVQIAQPQQTQQSQWPGQAGGSSDLAPLPSLTAASSASFDTAPEPDYRALLDMLLAANPDAFNSPEFALYYASLQLPPFPDRRCSDFVNGLGNEISRRRITEEAKAALGAVLAASPRTEQVRVFRIVTRETAKEYDFERGGFPVETRYSHSPFQQNWHYSSQRPQAVCSPRAASGYFGEYHGHRIEIPIPVQVGEPLLVMGPDQAQGFIDRNSNRFFETEWLIEVRALTGSLAGRVLAARAREPHGGPVLYEFDPALFQSPAVADASAVVPLSKYVMALHALHRIPDLLDQRQLLELTRIQVEADQRSHGPDYASTGKGVVPVFTAEQVEGRHSVLAAEELVPVYRAYLRQLASSPPARLRVDNIVGRPIYDSAAAMLVCCEHQRREAFALLGIPRPSAGMPESIRHRGLYDIRFNSWDDQAPSAGIRDAIQRHYMLPGVDVIAFDRRLELKGIPSDRASAEQLLLELGQHQLTATVEFTVEDVRRDLAQPGDRSVVSMLARLEQVIISGPNGEVARLPATAFPEALPPQAEQPPSHDVVAQAPSHERLTLAYLASQPQLADDPTFAQRYAAAANCEAWTAKRGDEFARADLGNQAGQRLRDALAGGAGARDRGPYRVSIEAKVGEYDFANQRFPLEVPTFNQQIYRNLLDAPVPALLIEHEGKACRRDSVASPSFPDAFLLTLAGAKAIDAAGMPADQAAARAFVQRDLPPYRDPRAVEIEMLVTLSEIAAPRRTHPQREEHVSVVAGTVISARVLDAHSGEPVFDYGTQLFDGLVEPVEAPALAAMQPVPGTEAVPVLRPEGPYGPDMAGIRLGMSFEEAEAIIRGSMQVGFVFQVERDAAQGIRGLQPYNSGRIFVSPDVGEAIGIFDEPPAAQGIVLGAWRRVGGLDPNLLNDDVAALLAEKYGPPARSQEARWDWGESAATRACAGGGAGQRAVRLTLVEGAERSSLERTHMLDLERLKSSPPRFWMDDPGLPPEIGRFRDCGPVVRASFSRQQLDVTLFDYAHYNDRYLASYELLRDGFVGRGDVKVAQRILGTAPTSASLEKLSAATIDLAALAKMPSPLEVADDRGADAFKILNVTVGMTEAEALAAIAAEFSPDQIVTDPKHGALSAARGPCHHADPDDPAIASEAGAFCLELQLTEGTVSHVALRQVVLGDVSERALAAFQERYGEPTFEAQAEPGPSVQRSVIGWGRPLGGRPLDLAQVDPDAPTTVLEGQVWWSHGVTVAILRLDQGRPAQGAGSDSLAGSQEIEF